MKVNKMASAIAAALIGVQAHAVDPDPGTSDPLFVPMAIGENGWTPTTLFTVGENFDGYYPPGILDGLGAYELDEDTVRVLASHELRNQFGYDYTIPVNGISLKGARISYFDIDKASRRIVDAGPAYDTIYDANGDVGTQETIVSFPGFEGLSRFCSSQMVVPGDFKKGGVEDKIYFTGEEDGGNFNPVGGAEWALDVENDELWAVPEMGRGAWENITAVDARDDDVAAFILADDSSPFDADGDDEAEAAPLFLYVGEKDRSQGAGFLARNGLDEGKLYVLVMKDGSTTPEDFSGTGSKLQAEWVEIDNEPTGPASDDGSSGFDQFGYPTQSTLWTRAEALGAFGFSRPEDVAFNPRKKNEIVLASTGVDTYVGGADTFGTMYTVVTNFENLTASIEIIYDGDDDPTRALRSPDNLDWADDGLIYVQEDEAEEKSPTGEPLFGFGAANPKEASIVALNPNNGKITRVAEVNRGVVYDASIDNPTRAFDVDFGFAGEWESSGILDVSTLFGETAGTLFLFDVQAHGIEDQTTKSSAPNFDSSITDDNLVEGGQLLFLEAPSKRKGDDYADDDD